MGRRVAMGSMGWPLGVRERTIWKKWPGWPFPSKYRCARNRCSNNQRPTNASRAPGAFSSASHWATWRASAALGCTACSSTFAPSASQRCRVWYSASLRPVTAKGMPAWACLRA
ncbi:hypothetical protein D3C76_1256830 [compost metagenome]